MNWGFVAKLRMVFRWTVVVGLLVIGVAALFVSHSLGAGLALLFAALSAVPPVHALLKQRFVSGVPTALLIILTLIGLSTLGVAEGERQARQAREEGWTSVLDRERALAAGYRSPSDWAPHREAAEAVALRQKAGQLEQEALARAAAEEVKRREEAQCKDNLNCWAEKHHIQATSSCRGLIERLGQYQFEWTDKWHEPKFSHFRWRSQQLGIVTYIGDRIKFQNGFGAWQFHIYECDFNPNSGQIIDVRATPGRL